MSQFMDEEGTPTKNSLYMNTGQAEDPWYTQGESPTAEYANNNNQSFDYNTNNYNNNIAEEGPEEPLLEELGVNFDKIWVKTQAVLYPTKRISTHILDDADLAGPLCFCLLLGACLLFSGKVQFGYIYGFSVFGCLSLQAIMNLIHPVGLDFWRTCSVLGYCLLPVIALAAVGVVVRLKGLLVGVGVEELHKIRLFRLFICLFTYPNLSFYLSYHDSLPKSGLFTSITHTLTVYFF